MPNSTERLTAALEGRYRILRRVGEGGMALVYLAEDLKHHRQVALKILRPELAAALGPPRFLREIEIAARLTHPNILPLLDSGDAEGTLFYVMPYVEGESLRERLVREGQLPVEEAVRITQRVATALGYAHALGVVHRDIKPENILLSGGEPVITDFGIAKAVSAAGQTNLTESGFAIGTAPYMSPEQSGGERQLDGRSDLYSLGCVLYELLAGTPPYTGPTLHAITARKLAEPVPSLRTVRDTVPVLLEQVVFKALARLPADRYATGQQLAEALEAARTAATTPGAPVPAYASRPDAVRAGARTVALVGAIAVTAAGAGATLTWRHFAARSPDLPVARFAVQPPAGDSIFVRSNATSSLTISPDGRRIAFLGVHGGDAVPRLFLHDVSAGSTVALAGTEGASAPFFRPDGEWIGYFEAGSNRLMKVPTQGGQPQRVCECGPSEGADWGSDGWIVLDPSIGRSLTGLLRVRETGGLPEPLPISDSTFTPEVWSLSAPQLLPGGDVALVTAAGSAPSRISAISLRTGVRTDLIPNAWVPRYMEPGWLIYAKARELWAVRFDPKRLTLSGEPTRLLDSVQAAPDMWAEYAVSRSGTLVYSRPVGVTGRDGMRPVWVDRDGRRTEHILSIPGGYWMGVRLATDGQRIVYWGFPYDANAADGGRLFLYDPAHGAPRALTDAADTYAWPIFTPDGRGVISNSNHDRKQRYPLYRTPLDGGAAERLTDFPRTAPMQQPYSWSPDGTTLAFQQGYDPVTRYDIYLLSLNSGRQARPLLATRANERAPMFSPDGRWLAYVSDESGRAEVYVRPYPAFDAPVQVTRDGGDAPAWSPDGRYIFFEHGRALYHALFLGGRPGAPQLVVDLPQHEARNALISSGPFGRMYDVARDGRLLMLQAESNVPNGTEYHVVLNWVTELHQRLAGRQP
ncbi:MAG: protein kinase [Gemmatimonadales bacterium]